LRLSTAAGFTFLATFTPFLGPHNCKEQEVLSARWALVRVQDSREEDSALVAALLLLRHEVLAVGLVLVHSLAAAEPEF
jgi:hypothetical protein